jgi:hypothetical protein
MNCRQIGTAYPLVTLQGKTVLLHKLYLSSHKVFLNLFFAIKTFKDVAPQVIAKPDGMLTNLESILHQGYNTLSHFIKTREPFLALKSLELLSKAFKST